MAKYTLELREIISTFGREEVKSWFEDYNLEDFLTTEEIQVINDRHTWSKEKLAEKIIDRYYTREIGSDGIGQFILFVKDKMNEIMETYAPLIYSASINYDPLVNVNYTETFSGSNNNNSYSNSNSNGSGLTVNSDTPQGQISKNDILTGKYASSTGANESTNSVIDNSNTTGQEQYTKTTKGNSGVTATAQALIKQYRNNIRAIDSEIINDLAPLFMGIY